MGTLEAICSVTNNLIANYVSVNNQMLEKEKFRQILHLVDKIPVYNLFYNKNPRFLKYL
jgi:hypothetical protein